MIKIAAALLAGCVSLAAVTGLGPAMTGEGEGASMKTSVTATGSLMYPQVQSFLDARAGEFEKISPERRTQLEKLSAFVRQQHSKDGAVRLTFICTHNSRRSHMGQILAAAAAEYYGLRATTYSGGTEATAFNPRAVASLERAGFKIAKTTNDSNPIYHVRLGETLPALTCFSKKYDGAPNPTADFGAVMVCDHADEACPIVAGATARISLPYVDPKVSDGTPQEAATYDDRSAEIARELMYAMSKAAG